MKKIIFLFVAVFMFGCTTQKNDSQIIANYENEYNYKADGWENGSQNGILLQKQKSEIEKKIAAVLKSENFGLNLKMRLFVNEQGKLDYLKFLEGSKRFLGNKNNKEMILNLLNEQSFARVTSNGKGMKYAFDISIRPDGAFDEDEYSVAAEKMPRIVGGVKSLAKNIIYPESAKKEGIEGRVYIKVFIDEKGNVVKAEVLKGIGYGCNEAALSAVENLHFIPAENNGKKIKSQVVIPVMFRLQ